MQAISLLTSSWLALWYHAPVARLASQQPMKAITHPQSSPYAVYYLRLRYITTGFRTIVRMFTLAAPTGTRRQSLTATELTILGFPAVHNPAAQAPYLVHTPPDWEPCTL